MITKVTVKWEKEHPSSFASGYPRKARGLLNLQCQGRTIIHIAVVQHPFHQQGGDGYVIREHVNDQLSIAVFDGLGHGERAVCAAEAFRDIWLNAPSYEPYKLLSYAHPLMRQTAGAACMVVSLDRKNHSASYA